MQYGSGWRSITSCQASCVCLWIHLTLPGRLENMAQVGRASNSLFAAKHFTAAWDFSISFQNRKYCWDHAWRHLPAILGLVWSCRMETCFKLPIFLTITSKKGIADGFCLWSQSRNTSFRSFWVVGLGNALGQVQWLPLLEPGLYRFQRIQFSIPGSLTWPIQSCASSQWLLPAAFLPPA